MARKTPPLELSRSQILRFRRRVGSLDERLAAGTKSPGRAAWAGLQDSMPRAALLSIHARMEGAPDGSPLILRDVSLNEIYSLNFDPP
jgi:hypothetical protein